MKKLGVGMVVEISECSANTRIALGDSTDPNDLSSS